MTLRGARAALVAWGLAALVIAGVTNAHVQAPVEPHLELLWSRPLPSHTSANELAGQDVFRVTGVSAPADGSVTMFGWRGSPTGPRIPLLLTQAQMRGPESAVLITLSRPQQPSISQRWPARGRVEPQRNLAPPTKISFAVDPLGDIWSGGFVGTGERDPIRCGRRNYLTRLRNDGNPVWQQEYEGSCGYLASIAPIRNGGAVVLGLDVHHGGGMTWLGRVSQDGTLLSERRFGRQVLGGYVMPQDGGRFLIVGVDFHRDYSSPRVATADDGHFRLSTWLLTASDELLGPHLILEEPFGSGRIERVAASATADGAFIALRWAELREGAQLDVIRVRANGEVAWRHALVASSTALARFGQSCRPALATLPDGDAVLACAAEGIIHLYRLAREDGTPTLIHLPLPDCHGATPELFLAASRDALFLAGSGPDPFLGPGCSWLARLRLGSG